jgi:hypothetical protein
VYRTRLSSISAALLCASAFAACSGDAEPAEEAPVVAAADSGTAAPMEETRSVADGGIFVPGWSGRIDASEAQAGMVLENARFAQSGDTLRVTTGPAVTYWNPANTASGNYTVRATFTEPQYMNLNNHPHPYGIVIAGNDMGTEQQTFLYCAAYGNGNFIVRGFGPAPFQLNGPRGEANAAVNQAAGPGQPVTQQIAMTVNGGQVTCSINGTVVATYDRATLVAPERLRATDGVYGLRFAHNTEATVTGLTLEPAP